MKHRVMIVDEHMACRQMLAHVLNAEKSYEIVAEAEDGRTALIACKCQKPDILVLELVLPALCGKEVLRRMRSEFPRVRVLIFSGTRNHLLVREALRCYPQGYVDKRDSLTTFLEALHAIAAGRSYFSAFPTPLLLESSADRSLGLTAREVEVLQLVAESCSSKEIAARLGLSTKTVENHRAHIMEKLHVHDTAAMALYAFRTGLVS